ncbi:MAG: metallophosphoesterase [Deltaproteobacteria bacterium]|nr:metallophosphoesterase [Deltaproteobacteria bacterium]
MAWWHKLFNWLRPRPHPAASRQRRIYIVSDLHLGEEVGAGDAPFVEYINALNTEFSAFVATLTADSADRPTTLVIDGDSFDFIRAVVQPNPIEARLIQAQPLTPRQARLGLDSSRQYAVWKLGRIIGFHRPVFEALARLVSAGNDLVFVRGNHDVELYWPEVRAAIVAEIARLAGVDEATAEARVRFEPWFYYEPQLVYVEHGHQYDPHCSYADLLDPVEDEGRMLALPYASWSIRHFAPLLHGMPAAEMDAWGFVDFARWVFSHSPARIVWAIVTYFRLMIDLLARKSWRHTVGRPATHARHLRRLTKLAERAQLPLEVVERIDALKEKPVEERFLGITLAYYLDRFMLLFLSLVSVVVAAVLPVAVAIRVAAICGVLLVTLALHEVTRRLRDRRAEPHLPEKALLLSRLVDVPFVVFGHSHQAGIHAAPPTRPGAAPCHYYLNSGHWVARYRGQPSLFNYIEVIAEGGVRRARLMRWQGDGRAPFEVAVAAPPAADECGDGTPAIGAAGDDE